LFSIFFNYFFVVVLFFLYFYIFILFFICSLETLEQSFSVLGTLKRRRRTRGCKVEAVACTACKPARSQPHKVTSHGVQVSMLAILPRGHNQIKVTKSHKSQSRGHKPHKATSHGVQVSMLAISQGNRTRHAQHARNPTRQPPRRAQHGGISQGNLTWHAQHAATSQGNIARRAQYARNLL